MHIWWYHETATCYDTSHRVVLLMQPFTIHINAGLSWPRQSVSVKSRQNPQMWCNSSSFFTYASFFLPVSNLPNFFSAFSVILLFFLPSWPCILFYEVTLPWLTRLLRVKRAWISLVSLRLGGVIRGGGDRQEKTSPDFNRGEQAQPS